MGKVADNWLVEVDRQAFTPYLAELAGTGVAASSELGEAFRRLTFPRPVDSSLVTASGLTRFAMPIEWEGDEAGCAERFAGTPADVVALRRHDRFAAARLKDRLPNGKDLLIAVAGGRVLAGRIAPEEAGSLPRRQPVAGPSRAGEKLAEAMPYLATIGFACAGIRRWLELGAFPGGMTTELSRRGYLVTALDVHPPTREMSELPGVTCVTGPAESFVPTEAFDALLCDVNGSPGKTARTVGRLSDALAPGGLLIHTLKLPRWDAATALVREAKERFAAHGLDVFAVKHLRQNRQELTLFGRKETPRGHVRDR